MQLADNSFVEKEKAREVGLPGRFTLIFRCLQNCVSTASGEKDRLAEEMQVQWHIQCTHRSYLYLKITTVNR
jgi:hypothetical protein